MKSIQIVTLSNLLLSDLKLERGFTQEHDAKHCDHVDEVKDYKQYTVSHLQPAKRVLYLANTN